MGQSTDGLLVYGYHLDTSDEFHIQEVDEYGGPDPERFDWYDGLDFVGQGKQRLLASVGFTETDWRVDGYFERERAAKAAVGVKFESHCSDECPMYFLAAHTVRVARGYPQVVDFAALTEQAKAEDWDGKLAKAVEALGITPTQDGPRWFLASERG